MPCPRPNLPAIESYLLFLALGLGTGAVYAALGLGLVLEHRVSGVVNFAHGAMAMYPAYVFAEARGRGDLVLPVVGIPSRVHLADRPSFVLALGLGVLSAALLGLVVYALVFRPLRHAPPLARVVASVGVMVVLQAVVVLQFGTANRPVAPVLPNEPISVLGLAIPRDRLYLAALVLVAAVALWALYRFTRFGLASRATAENERMAGLLGYRVGALAAVNWVLASVLAGLAGILAAPITSLNPRTYILLVVPALAAALVGRLSSFGVTVAAAFALGMLQSEIVKLQGTFDWLPRQGLREGLPLVVIVVVMAVAGRRLPERGRPEPGGTGLPAAGSPKRVLLTASVVVPATALVMAVLGGDQRLALVTSLIGALICLSLVVLTGYLGQISLAQMAFAGVAGFTLAKLSSGWGVPFPLAPLMAALAAGALGALVGLPALRVRGVNLAVVTIAAAVAVEELLFRNPALTGGFEGSTVPPPSLFGLDLGIVGSGGAPTLVFGLLTLAVVAGAAVAVAQVRRGWTGRRMLAIRANERASAATGVNVAAAKVAAFGVSAFLAGVAGALLGYQQGQLSYSSFSVFVSLSFLAVAYLGGIASVSGAMVGGALVAGGIVFSLADEFAGWGKYQVLAGGLGLVVIAVCYPRGLAGAGERLVARVRSGVRGGPDA